MLDDQGHRVRQGSEPCGVPCGRHGQLVEQGRAAVRGEYRLSVGAGNVSVVAYRAHHGGDGFMIGSLGHEGGVRLFNGEVVRAAGVTR
ncbi:hypothetical protein ABZZ20_09430 [Streptomyces sp. NPDC006430]|uniref:hypothetical protein n=1 Tax=Streptomyces sp. NPDC006430 TaxID=3154299 RepID=UPI00339F922B